MRARVSSDHRQVFDFKLHVLSLSSMHSLPLLRSPFCVSCRYTHLTCHSCDTRHPRSQLDSTNFVRLVCASAIISLDRRGASSWRLPKSLHQCPSAEVTAHFSCFSDGFISWASWTHAPRQLGAKSRWQCSRVLNSTDKEHSTSIGLTELISSSSRRKCAQLTPDDPLRIDLNVLELTSSADADQHF